MPANVERIPLARLEARRIVLTSAEAIAVVQTLVATGVCGTEPHRPLGPPSPRTVLIGEDGSVVLRGCSVTPIVLEIGALLHQLLPPGTPGVSGALRFTIGRALHEVIAPPFESLAELSRALARFETRDRGEIVRALFARAAGPAPPALAPRGVFRTIGVPIGATILAGLALIGAGEAMHASRQSSVAVGSRQSTVVSRQSSDGEPRQPEAAETESGVAGPKPPAARTGAVGGKKEPGLPSRVITRIRIKDNEL